MSAGEPLAMPKVQLVHGRFDDIDVLAAAALDWDQEYQQIGRGRFHGELKQLVCGRLQLNREHWKTGVLQSGAAPSGSWVFGLPLKADGPLHVRRQPVRKGELLAGTSRDDVGFVAEGETDLMIVVLPDKLINRWMRARRGADSLDLNLPPRNWRVTGKEIARRAKGLLALQDEVINAETTAIGAQAIAQVEARVSETIFDLIPSAETVESLPNRSRIAREVLRVFHDRLDDPPTVTSLCEDVGARERTLYLSCIEAFGRPPAQLLLELRLNAVRRALTKPILGTTVTTAASRFGFIHLGRFSGMYKRQFGELPSATLAASVGCGR